MTPLELETVNPQGRLDVAAYRAAQAAAARLAPGAWPYLRPAVHEAVSRHVPRTLGEVSILERAWDYLITRPFGLLGPNLTPQLNERVYGTAYQPPTPPPAPSAPDDAALRASADRFDAWTPEKQRAADLEAWTRWKATAIPPLPAGATEASTWLWIAAGAGVLGAILLLRGNK